MKYCIYVFFSLKDKQKTEDNIGECCFCTGINVIEHIYLFHSKMGLER